MKRFNQFFAVLALTFIIACTALESPAPQADVSFKVQGFHTETGNLKSFDIDDWEHFHSGNPVYIHLTETTSGDYYKIYARDTKEFFEEGSEPITVPFGTYDIAIEGGNFPEGGGSYSSYFYMWSVGDTAITIDRGDNIFNFELKESAGLAVKDYQDDIQLIGVGDGNDTLCWTGRGDYDYAYLTPWDYEAIYTDEHNNTDTVTFTLERDKYVYFVTPDLTGDPEFGFPEVPVFDGDSIVFDGN